MEKFVIQWHLTHRCNLRCKHCYQEDYNKDLDFEELLKIYRQILDFLEENKDKYKIHINFTGGEPLLSKNLDYLMDFCDRDGITYGILTNGTMINEDKAIWLSTFKNLKFVQVSLDGSERVHDSIRGKGNFDKAVNGLKQLKKVGIETMVSFTASNNNVHDLVNVIRICQRLGVDRFWTDRLVPMGSNSLDTMTDSMFRYYIDTLSKEIRRSEFLRKLKLSKTYIHNNRAMQFLCGVDNCRSERRDSGYKCSAGKNLVAILADGTLLPCRRLPIELGNLTTENLSDILKYNDKLKEICSIEQIEDCKKCIFNTKCNSGAKCLTYAVNGELHGKDINCLMTDVMDYDYTDLVITIP